MHRVPHLDLSLRIECIQRGWGGQTPHPFPGPRDPLAPGVRSGILNLALWGPGDEHRREGRAAAHLRSFRLLALIAGRYGPRPGLGVRGPGARSGAPAERAAEGPGWAAPARRDRGSNGAAVSLRPSSPTPPRRPRPPQPRGLPGLVVPSVASARSLPDTDSGDCMGEGRSLGMGSGEGGGGKGGGLGDAVPRHNRGGR